MVRRNMHVIGVTVTVDPGPGILPAPPGKGPDFMKMLAKAIAVAVGTLVCAGTAQAATYVVTANGNKFDASLARKLEAAGGVVTARLPQVGLAIVESSDAGFQQRASRVPGIFSVARDIELPLRVVDMSQPGTLLKILRGEAIGTLVQGRGPP